MGYYLWLSNRMNLYYREYLTFIDAISNIGGVSNVIISIFFFINKIFNNYAIYSDLIQARIHLFLSKKKYKIPTI